MAFLLTRLVAKIGIAGDVFQVSIDLIALDGDIALELTGFLAVVVILGAPGSNVK